MASSIRQKIGILWFRSDLRLHDNNSLNRVIDLISQKKLDKVIPFYCYEVDKFEGRSRQAKIGRAGPHRLNFEIESVQNLRENLVNKLASNLYASYGKPVVEIMKLIDLVEKSYPTATVDIVVSTKEICTEELAIEKELQKLLESRKKLLMLVWDMTMIHFNDLPDQVCLKGDLKKFPDVFTFFRKSVEIQGKEGSYNVRAVRSLEPNYRLPTFELETGWKENVTPLKQEHIQVPKSAIHGMNGGETEALKRMKHYFFETQGLHNYKSTRNGLIGTEYSSKFSLWLAFGSLSARDLYHQVKVYEAKNGPTEGTKCMLFELLWRDFFKFISKKYGSQLFNLNGYNELVNSAKYKWKSDMPLFERWCRGETGYPFVDANMRELNATGFMSNRGRQNVASFLTKDLGIDWRWGAEYFEAMLVDSDTCSNWGNWQYAAGVGSDPRQDRYFNVIKQAYDYDSNGDYARLWLPELTNVSNDLIYCPFRMSNLEQKRFGCILGKDYPEPIVKMKFEWKPSSRNKVNKFASNQANSARK